MNALDFGQNPHQPAAFWCSSIRSARMRRRPDGRHKRLATWLYGPVQHLWIELPTSWTRSAFAGYMRSTGMGVAASDAFTVSGPPGEAVRICLGGQRAGRKLRPRSSLLFMPYQGRQRSLRRFCKFRSAAATVLPTPFTQYRWYRCSSFHAPPRPARDSRSPDRLRSDQSRRPRAAAPSPGSPRPASGRRL
jgi:hypothetical protein